MRGGWWFSAMTVCAFVAMIAACSSDNGSSQPVVDGDQITDGDQVADGDIVTDGDMEMESEGDGETFEPFVYDACADPATVYQFPHPAWETEGDTLTGVLLKAPKNDRASTLLKSENAGWHSQLGNIDGFALSGSWFVALNAEGGAIDAQNLRFYRWSESGVSMMETPLVSSSVIAGENVLWVKVRQPLPPSEKGEKYILALYDGIVADAQPLPACNGANAHEAYVEAANALVRAGEAENLKLALPFTPSRITITQRNLYESLEESPQLSVESVVEHEGYAEFGDTLGEFAPDAETLALLADKAYSGLLVTPKYLNDNNQIDVDLENEVPTATGTTKPGYFLALPKSGAAPYPVVIFQHGGSRFKYDLLEVAKPYLENGIAMLGVDLLYHGDRSGGDGNGSDMDMVNFDSPAITRDNFRQTSADHLALITGLDAFNEALASHTGAATTLDKDNVFYMGHSMGSVSGTITSSVASRVKGASLIAGGGPYSLLLTDGYFSIFVLDLVNPNRPQIEREILLSMLQVLLDGGDPVNFPYNLEDAALAPKDVLLWEIIGDPVLINPGTDLQGHAYRTALAEPFDHAVADMTSLAQPIADNFSFPQGNGSATRVLYHEPAEDGTIGTLHMDIFLRDVSHETAAACFAGRVAGEGCRFRTP